MSNKNLIFLISMLIISVLLFLLRMTGLTAHIILSVLDLAIMVPLTLMTRKPGKFPLQRWQCAHSTWSRSSPAAC